MSESVSALIEREFHHHRATTMSKLKFAKTRDLFNRLSDAPQTSSFDFDDDLDFSTDEHTVEFMMSLERKHLAGLGSDSMRDASCLPSRESHYRPLRLDDDSFWD